MKYRILVLTLLIQLAAVAAYAQTTEFTYQGSLKDGPNEANGNYDFEFALFDTLSTGSQIGAIISKNNVVVANGIFSVKLDFGSVFPGANRYLEIHVRPAGQPGITTLAPRQLVNSSPYSVTAANAVQLGGIAASQFVVTTDPRLTDARQPLPGSANYIQNQNASAQSSSNFNISGDGTVGGTMRANVLRAATTLNINSTPVLSIGGVGNTFVGAAAGAVNTGTFNAFFGNQAGSSNSTGSNNAFFGGLSGDDNTTGSNNSFFGKNAGSSNTDGVENTYFGASAGAANVTGDNNSFFGFRAGAASTAGNNSFFGHLSGSSNTTGNSNSFFGLESGAANTSGSLNSFFGHHSGNANTTGIQNSFFGTSAGSSNTTGINNAFFGEISGVDNTTGSLNVFFGAFSGQSNTTGGSNAFFGFQAGSGNSTGNSNTAIGNGAGFSVSDLVHATAIGASASVGADNTIALGRTDGSDRVRIYGRLAINTLAVGTSTTLCINPLSDDVAACSSSIRYKTNVATFNTGLGLVNRLRPVTFDWRESNENDLGLIAEEVEGVDPLLVTHNKTGEVQGVKYDRISVVLVNAVKEQQAQIEAQKAEIEKQRSQIDLLTKLVCVSNKDADICKEK